MRRQRQTIDELMSVLSRIDASWQDAHSEAVMRVIEQIPRKDNYAREDIKQILDNDFDAGMTAIRLVLDKSKDAFSIELRAALTGIGVTAYRKDWEQFVGAIERLGFFEAAQKLVSTPVSWKSILVERLKSGRGSAIQGQTRGRYVEDITEKVVCAVFGEKYDTRCRFVGSTGLSTEKADFAIPSKEDPRILIEAKGYGATGSKQTDILGDVSRIVQQKRHDTHFLLVTDGITWKARINDLRTLVQIQNQGQISRIYTLKMMEDLEADLHTLRDEHGLQ